MRVVRVIVAWALLCAPAVAQAPEDLLAAAGRLMDTNEYVPAIDIHNSIPESAPAPIREIGAGRTPEEALRRTKIAYVDHPQYAHPFYWSSLVITGDGAQALVTEPLGPPRALSILAILLSLAALAIVARRLPVRQAP